MPKNWEANDIEMGRLTVNQETVDGESYLNVEQYYYFVDSNGDRLPDLSQKTVSERRPMIDVPQDIVDGLSAIQDFLKNKATTEEGL